MPRSHLLSLLAILALNVGIGSAAATAGLVLTVDVAGGGLPAEPVAATLTLEARDPARDQEPPAAQRLAVQVPGRVELDLPPGSSWQLRLACDGYWSAPLDLEATEKGTGELLLFPVGWVRGELAPTAGPPPDAVEARFMATATRTAPKEPEVPQGMQLCDLADRIVRCSLPAGPLDLQLRADGFAPIYLWDFKLGAGAVKDLGRLELVRGASVTGRVADENGQPLAEAEVSLAPFIPSNLADSLYYARSRQQVWQTTTDARGFFQLTGVSAGAFQLKATKEGYAPLLPEDPVALRADLEEVLPEPLVLLRPTTLALNLTPPLDPFGKPWRVEMREVDGELGRPSERFSGPASEDGRWAQTGINPGPYDLKVLDSGDSRWLWETIEVQPDQPELFFDLPLLRLIGTVTMDGEPVPGELRLRPAEPTQEARFTVDEEGEFTGWLPEEAWWWVEMRPAEQDGVVLALDRIEIESKDGEDTVELEIELPNTRIEGEVVNGRGEPVVDAKISILCPPEGKQRTRRPPPLSSVRSGEDGRFEIWGLRPGPQTVIAAKSGLASANVGVELIEDLVPPFLRIELRENVAIEVKAVSATGPVAGAMVVALEDLRSSPLAGGFARAANASSGITGPDGSVTLEVAEGVVAVLMVVRAPGFGARLLRELVDQDRPIVVQLNRSHGRLIIDLTTPHDPDNTERRDPVVFHQGAWFRVQTLRRLLRSRSQPEAVRFELDQMESGWYALCFDPESLQDALNRQQPAPESCTTGFLPAHGELLLAAPQAAADKTGSVRDRPQAASRRSGASGWRPHRQLERRGHRGHGWAGHGTALQAIKIGERIAIEVRRDEKAMTFHLKAAEPEPVAIEYWLLTYVYDNFSEAEFKAYQKAASEKIRALSDD